MANLSCPRCRPIRTTMMRSSAALDLDALSPGPVPGSRCGRCGAQLHIGRSTSTRSPMMRDEKYRPFVVGVIAGCILWSLSGGFIHAYVISPDWGAMGQNAIASLTGWKPVLALMITGLAFGFCVEAAKFLGAVFRSEGAVLLLPLVAGALIRVLQAQAMASDVWGFAADTHFRGDDLRVVTGAVCGFILSYPTVVIGIALRRRGVPW